MVGKYKIAIVGEAFGEEEAKVGRPFVGRAGQQLNELLDEAGILREQCFITNTFNFRPSKNDITSLCGGKRDSDCMSEWPPLAKGKYLLSQYRGEIDRLHAELAEVSANVTVLLGNTACWAVLRGTAISKIRGTVNISVVPPGLKVLPTYHPAAILRNYELRPVTIMDLVKARIESEYPDLRRPYREIWMDPTLEDLTEFYNVYLEHAGFISVDVETIPGQVTCIGLSPMPGVALVIPFLDFRSETTRYWSPEDEALVWHWLRFVLNLPGRHYIFQNGNYDLQFLWKQHGLTVGVGGEVEDTMLIHHALHPESPKSLAFLGSVYTNEIAWKPLRPKSKHNEKPGDEE